MAPRILLIAVMIWSLILLACNGPRRVGRSSPVPGDTSPPGSALGGKEPPVRVLLAEGFSKVDLRNGSRDLSVEVRGGRLVLLERLEGQVREVDSGTGFRLAPDAECIVYDGNCYAGFVDVFLNPLGLPVVVNEIGLERYLESVVPRELGPRSYPHLEALKAQSVAARTFAVSSLGMYAHRGFDVFRDSRSQEYPGLAGIDPLSSQAVQQTRGVIAAYKGRPIVALYSSTCGGKTEAFDLIFRGGPIDYLCGGSICSDSSSRYYQWEESIDLRDRAGSLKAYARLERVKDLKPLALGKSGRVVEMEFRGDGHQAVLKGNDIRFALGLRSNLIEEMREIRDADGFIERLEVRGRGWGHGVGMCQIGAVEMARDGRGYDEILRHYYPGIELTHWF